MMPSTKQVACAVCGGAAWWNPNGGSLDRDSVTCRSCRWERVRQAKVAQGHQPGTRAYSDGCRCPDCRRANTIACGNRFGRGETTRTCRVCSAQFTSRIPAQVNCSEACRKESLRMHHAARRASLCMAQTGEPVIPLKIFKRDAWRCHICRRKLSPQTVFPHRRAATIDHLIPLSKGGAHEPANVKTACHQCNSAKNNRGGNEQLLLIG